VGQSDADVTLLYRACARCTPSTKARSAEGTLPLEAYCPGTQRAIAKLLLLFTSQKIPVQLQIRSELPTAEMITHEVSCGNYDIVVVPSALSESLLSQIRTPLLVLPAALLKTN